MREPRRENSHDRLPAKLCTNFGGYDTSALVSRGSLFESNNSFLIDDHLGKEKKFGLPIGSPETVPSLPSMATQNLHSCRLPVGPFFSHAGPAEKADYSARLADDAK